jgi:phospholipase C
MGYYGAADLPYYFTLAETFALSDAHFSALVGPNDAQSQLPDGCDIVWHVLTSESDDTPPTITGYKPITGTVFDLFDKYRVSWAEYFEPGDGRTPQRPYGALFRDPSLRNFKSLREYFADARAGKLPAIVFISLAQHEHPPLDVRAGEYSVARVVTALRTSPNWKDSVLLFTYDENGGYYDHARPPAAPSPDGISPGRCADLNKPPIPRTPGKGSGCELSAEAQREVCAMARAGERCCNVLPRLVDSGCRASQGRPRRDGADHNAVSRVAAG